MIRFNGYKYDENGKLIDRSISQEPDWKLGNCETRSQSQLKM